MAGASELDQLFNQWSLILDQLLLQVFQGLGSIQPHSVKRLESRSYGFGLLGFETRTIQTNLVYRPDFGRRTVGEHERRDVLNKF